MLNQWYNVTKQIYKQSGCFEVLTFYFLPHYILYGVYSILVVFRACHSIGTAIFQVFNVLLLATGLVNTLNWVMFLYSYHFYSIHRCMIHLKCKESFLHYKISATDTWVFNFSQLNTQDMCILATKYFYISTKSIFTQSTLPILLGCCDLTILTSILFQVFLFSTRKNV